MTSIVYTIRCDNADLYFEAQTPLCTLTSYTIPITLCHLSKLVVSCRKKCYSLLQLLTPVKNKSSQSELSPKTFIFTNSLWITSSWKIGWQCYEEINFILSWLLTFSNVSQISFNLETTHSKLRTESCMCKELKS